MNKRFALSVYVRFWHAWRAAALTLLALSLALVLLASDVMRPYREVLWLSAGLAALTLALGFGMARLAFVGVGRDAIVIQLPLWRMRVPLDCIHATRLVTLEGAAPGIWKDRELSAMQAVLVEMRRWPQPERVLRFWLGRLVLPNVLLLPVQDSMGLRRALDTALTEHGDARRTAR